MSQKKKFRDVNLKDKMAMDPIFMTFVAQLRGRFLFFNPRLVNHHLKLHFIEKTPPKFNRTPKKMMVGNWKTICFWEGNLSGAMLNFSVFITFCHP